MTAQREQRPATAELVEEVRQVPRQVAAGELPPEQRRVRRRLVVARYPMLLGGLAVVTFAVYTRRTLALDVAVTRFVQGSHAAWYTWLLLHVSDLGFWPGNVIMVALIVLSLLALRLWQEAAIAVASILLAGGAVSLLKGLVHRPRPTPNLVHVAAHLTDPSFPSGHVVNYTVFYGFLFYVILDTWRRSVPRDLLLGLCLVLVALVGPSRIFLGEHWFSDTLGAYLLGAAWLGTTIELHVLLLARRGIATPRRRGRIWR
jgi:undecaprenyl-diphosphatase